MIKLKRDEVTAYGAVAIAIALFILVGGIGASAIRTEKNLVADYQGYDIYQAPDDSLSPNPKRSDGEYFYVKGHWSRAFTSTDGARDLAHVLYLEDLAFGMAPIEEPELDPDVVVEPEPEPEAETVTDSSAETVVDTVPTGGEMIAHFTVQKKITNHITEGHRKHEYEKLVGVVVNIFKKGSNTVWRNGITNSDGVIAFNLPTGKYEYQVITEGYEKYSANVQNWDEHGLIYYKKITLIREDVYLYETDVAEVGEVVDTTPVVEDPDTSDDSGDVVTVADMPDDDDEAEQEWEAPWEEGGGDAQLDGDFDSNVVTQRQEDNRLYVATGVIGLTGTIMLIASQFFMTNKR